jgi:DNA invertase Pin-like site-specific DNA recombinase
MRRIELDCAEVVALYRAGAPVRAIATKFGCSDGPVYRTLFEAGVRVSRKATIDPRELERLSVGERQSLVAVAVTSVL